MADTVTKLPVKSEGKRSAAVAPWRPFDDFRREINRMFEDFDGEWLRPFRANVPTFEPLHKADFEWTPPAVDFTEKQKAFEITAELPGVDAKNVEVTLRNGNIVITGEKREDSEETSKDYHVQERRFGSFERTFALPEGVEPDKIEASFSKGVLTVILPKTVAAQKPEKKISVKAA